jgi:murein DD-endopeptidase MepM/ murein hydrolase activator NlpD
MPAKGHHRRPKSQRFTRSLAVVTTGGAALALPLIGAAAAQAAGGTYTVKPHDTLSDIAQKQHVSGGWKKIFADNRKVVGDDPGLIRPGQKLVLDAAHKAKTAAKSSTADTAAKKSTGSSSGYTLPVQGGTLGTPWGTPGSMWASGHHTGQDFVVPSGTPVHAVAAGTVVTAGWGGAYGNQVVIQHADGKYTQYAHMSSLNVSAGQKVTEGQQIGVSGATGNVTGPHLHFEVRTGPDYGSDIDPIAYLRAHGVGV